VGKGLAEDEFARRGPNQKPMLLALALPKSATMLKLLQMSRKKWIRFETWSALVAVILTFGSLEAGESSRAAKVSSEDLRSLDPAEILAHLDLSRPGLESAAKAQQASDRAGALRALLSYYRGKFPLPKAPAAGVRRLLGRDLDRGEAWCGTSF
jgi:hypothetical protein